MSAREERLVTENNLWELDTWLDKVDVFAKPHFDYVNGQLVNTGIKFGNSPTRMTAFIGDTIVRHKDGTHTVLSAKDATELNRLRAERHSTNEALDDAVREVAALRARVAELEAAITHDDPCRPCGCPKRFDRHAWGCPTLPADDVPLLPQPRQVEDPHDSELHHTYALGRDLPTIPHQQDRRAM
jgi:hypothetical protein